jgi:flagellar hook protein FlgE
MNKIIYNKEYLENFCNKNNIILNNFYEKTNRNTKIEGNCVTKMCNGVFNKTFLYITKNGAFCENCTKINRKLNYKKTCLEKYGVENVFQLEIIKGKIIETNLVKYGVKNPTYSNQIRQKTKQKCFEKYGVEHTCQLQEVINKKNNAMIQKYGVKYPLQSELGQNNFKHKCLEKYGVENPQQVPEIAEKASKNSYRRKIYTFPSGSQITCQGYEPLAIDKLIKEENILENDIVTGCKNVPTIWYNDEEGKKHRHYVDIFILSQNRCIEIKSTWTAKKKIDNIFLKQNAGKEMGYLYEIWIYNNKGKIVEHYK